MDRMMVGEYGPPTNLLVWPGNEESLHRAVIDQWSDIFPELTFAGHEFYLGDGSGMHVDLAGYDKDGNLTLVEVKCSNYKGWVSTAWKQLDEYMRRGKAPKGILAGTWDDSSDTSFPDIRYVNLLRTALRAPDGRSYAEHWAEWEAQWKEVRIKRRAYEQAQGGRIESLPSWDDLEKSIKSRY